MNREPIRIRASSFGSLFDCPARWIAIHLEGKRSPQSGKAALGTALHAGTAVFDSERVAGQLPNVGAASDAAAEKVSKIDDETIWEPGEQVKAIDVATSLTAKYCKEESMKHQFAAVEATLDSLVIKDLGLELTGTTDRVEVIGGEYGVTDIKSGKTAVGTNGIAKTHGHAAQLGIYEIVAEESTGLQITGPAQIIGLQTNLTPDKQRIGTGLIVNAREVLLGNEQHTGLLVTASKLVHGDIDPWGNPKSMMCSEVYCPNFKQCFWRR
ncbi:RecB family exonuclease [Methylovorus glucosotrophus]|uniref:RecB n=1 Tax=Methylovorus glucosotrophus (strain SIP3-4) TaxID=582744 RepID=C6XED0_METGS|nr:PD-(D/E)XK nuclease family protein [Methylovorus glucosotrophus]ACT50905.1 RecB [Methylovorus glucosotrophus SIP3-4]